MTFVHLEIVTQGDDVVCPPHTWKDPAHFQAVLTAIPTFLTTKTCEKCGTEFLFSPLGLPTFSFGNLALTMGQARFEQKEDRNSVPILSQPDRAQLVRREKGAVGQD